MKNLFLAAATACVTFVGAQTTENSGLDVSIGGGFRSTSNHYITLAEFRERFPNSDLLNRDYSNFTSGFNSGATVSPMANILWGMRIKTTNQIEHRLRIGFTFSKYTSSSQYLNFSQNIPYDTLVSTQTGNHYYVDSVYTENLWLEQDQDVLTADFSYIIRNNPTGRFSFYGGLGIEVGAVLNARAYINYSQYSYLQNSANFVEYYSNSEYKSIEEQYELDPGFFANFYMPLGVDFRFGKTNAFWKRTHIFTEFRPGLQLFKQEDAAAKMQLNFGMAVVGLRFEF